MPGIRRLIRSLLRAVLVVLVLTGPRISPVVMVVTGSGPCPG